MNMTKFNIPMRKGRRTSSRVKLLALVATSCSTLFINSASESFGQSSSLYQRDQPIRFAQNPNSQLRSSLRGDAAGALPAPRVEDRNLPGNSLPGNSLPGNSLPGNSLPGNANPFGPGAVNQSPTGPFGPGSNVMNGMPPGYDGQGLPNPYNGQYSSLDQGSWTYIPIPPARQIRVNDIVTIRVDELSKMTSDGAVQTRKNNQYDAILQDWIRLVGLKAIKPNEQADGDQRARGQVQQQFRAQSNMETRESLTFNISAKIVDIRPNGNIVLEAHRQLQNNDEYWDLSLSGECRREDILPDNTIMSKHIVDLRIGKRERGHIRDSYKRGWLHKLYDQFLPF